MFDDLSELLKKDIKGEVLQEFATTGYQMTLEELLSLEDKFLSSGFELQKFYKSLVLLKLEGEETRGINHHRPFEKAAELIEYVPQEHKILVSNRCDSILVSELNATANEEEVLRWLQVYKFIHNITKQELPCFDLGCINFTNFMQTTAYKLQIQPTTYDICVALSHLQKAERCDLDVSYLVYIIAYTAISYIEEQNNGFGPDYEKDSKIIQDSDSILKWLKVIDIKDETLKQQYQYVLGKIEIHAKNIEPQGYNPDPTDIDYIDPGRIQKIDPPFIAHPAVNFDIWMFKAVFNGITNVVVKLYSPHTPNEDFSRITQEILTYQTLSKLASPKNCFLKYYGTFVEPGNKVNMVMESFPKNLMTHLTYLRNKNFVFTEELIAHLFSKLLNSFAQMEALRIYHGDIKPQNMLVDDFWNIKIIDFNCSLAKQEEITEAATGINPIQGTQGYRAPEVEEYFRQGTGKAPYRVEKADVFSLGMVFLQMILLIPVTGLNTKEKNPDLMQVVETVPFEWAQDLLKNMLDINPKKRNSFNNLSILMDEIKAGIPVSSVPNLIEIIDPDRFQTINPPLIARTTNKFHICIYEAVLDGDSNAAVKYYKPYNPNEDCSRIIQEIRVYQTLSELASPKNCFLKYYGTFVKEGNIFYMVMEYYPDNLMKYITYLKGINFVFTEELIAPLFSKLLNSFAEMESLGIYHGDIKPQNMLVDNQWNIKIIDFNNSLLKDEEQTELDSEVNPIQGTRGYVAPELIEYLGQKNLDVKYKVGKSDVFSLGMVFLQMILLIYVNDLNTKEKNPEVMLLIDTVPFEWARQLLKNMLDIDPKKRKRFRKLHRFIIQVEEAISARKEIN
jgi:serine/threonine protein kinase